MSQELRDLLAESTEELERIGNSPNDLATIVDLNDTHMLIASGKGSSVILRPHATVEVGQSIVVQGETRQYLKHNPFKATRIFGEVQSVSDGFALVDVAGVRRFMPTAVKVAEGDRVKLDDFSAIITEVVPALAGTKNSVRQETGVSWDDVRGNAEAKEALIEAIELPHTHPEIFQAYNQRPSKGILLYGPPGCGKTMLGKAAATAVGSIDGFILCNGPEVLNEYVGVAEATIRGLFARARAYHAETGKTAIIFIDEADALLGDRSARHAHMEKTIVPMFLTEMDGVREMTATVILSTNRSHSLDTAVVREGRVDRKIKVSRPTVHEADEIIQQNLTGVKLQGELLDLAAKTTVALWQAKVENKGQEYLLSQFVSGAMAAGIVSKAKSAALHRDIANRTVSGISLDDLLAAVEVTAREMGAISLEEHQ